MSEFTVFSYALGKWELEIPNDSDLSVGTFAWDTICNMLQIDPSQRLDACTLRDQFEAQLLETLDRGAATKRSIKAVHAQRGAFQDDNEAQLSDTMYGMRSVIRWSDYTQSRIRSTSNRIFSNSLRRTDVRDHQSKSYSDKSRS